MFITLEGPEGSGKTSQIGLLAAALRQRGYEILTTREPGGTVLGDEIRHVVHNVRHRNMSPVAEMLLYAASRAQHVAELIQPSLAAGKVVLCDRYADSTLAYQGYGRQLELADLRTITAIATGGLQPDLTLLLDLDVETGLERRAEGGLEMNRLDLETVAFHRRVRDGYQALMAAEPERWVRIDATQPPAVVQTEVLTAVLTRLTIESFS